MKKVVIVSNFFNVNSRPYLAWKYFQDKKMDIELYTANFDHYTKKLIDKKLKGIKYIDVPRYSTNISLKRIYSHIIFSIKMIKILKNKEIDILYVNMPPNILGYLLIKYIKANKKILDVIDLWPEALPIPKLVKRGLSPIFYFWKKIRKIAISNSDVVLTHTNKFYEHLNLKKEAKNSEIIYLKKIKNNFLELKYRENLKIVYVGNISHIYDFDSLVYLLKNMNATLEIIGDGPYREELINILNKEQINYNYHGIIFNETKKAKIIEECQFGYNGYKENTEVSMSYKSIDYFSYGLPVINSANGDTWNLVESKKLGYNFQNKNLEGLIKKINQLDEMEYFILNSNIKKIFIECFSYESFINEMDEIVKKLK